MAYGLLFLRVIVGLTLFAHGAQKLFGWWEGPGLGGIRGWLQSMGFAMPSVMALMVGLSEGSGLLFALGLFTPFAALLMASGMVVAIGSVHWAKGWWLSKGGYEYNLVLFGASVSVAATGPGRFSLDRAFGWDDNISGVWWGVGVLVLSLAAGLFILTALRSAPPPQQQEA
jgi:putative oxidoreductase